MVNNKEKKGILKDMIESIKNGMPMNQTPKQMPIPMKERVMPKKDEGGGMIPIHIRERMRREASLA